MAFRSGDHVHVANLGKGIVREVRNKDLYLVEIKGRSMIVAGTQLRGIEGRNRGVNPVGAQSDPAGTLTRAHAPAEIDLHGMTAAEAVAALDAFLNDALLAALAEVRVIHGRSGGRVKAAVHHRLRELPSIRNFRVDPANPGVTIVGL